MAKSVWAYAAFSYRWRVTPRPYQISEPENTPMKTPWGYSNSGMYRVGDWPG